MIPSIVRASWLALRRDRGAWILSFVLPVAFFSIFAVVFGQQRKGVPRVAVAVVDEDRSELSERLVEALAREPGLRAETAPGTRDARNAKEVAPRPYDRGSATAAVRSGDVPAALVLPPGFGAAPFALGSSEPGAAVLLLYDGSDPVAPEVVSGLLQKTIMTAAPDVLADRGVRYLDATVMGLTDAQRARVDEALGSLRESSRRGGPGGGARDGLVRVERQDVVAAGRRNPFVAFYAAGIAVMFLLFTSSAAGGALLDEAESGTLERVLATRVTIGTLLAGKLAYATLLALAQLGVMFTWGALVFGLELWSHVPGFLAMAVPTALACAAFGLVMASACRTRAQLGALSTLVILTVSAIGGSMFPRFLMSEAMQRFGLFAFNAWALDGFTKVFWREEPVSQLWPQIAFLVANAAAFFAIARHLARRRWDSA